MQETSQTASKILAKVLTKTLVKVLTKTLARVLTKTLAKVFYQDSCQGSNQDSCQYSYQDSLQGSSKTSNLSNPGLFCCVELTVGARDLSFRTDAISADKLGFLFVHETLAESVALPRGVYAEGASGTLFQPRLIVTVDPILTSFKRFVRTLQQITQI